MKAKYFPGAQLKLSALCTGTHSSFESANNFEIFLATVCSHKAENDVNAWLVYFCPATNQELPM